MARRLDAPAHSVADASEGVGDRRFEAFPRIRGAAIEVTVPLTKPVSGITWLAKPAFVQWDGGRQVRRPPAQARTALSRKRIRGSCGSARGLLWYR